MLKYQKHGIVTVFRMGRHIAGNEKWVLYLTHAYLIDDTLIDTGTIAVNQEWKQVMNDFFIRQVVNTHHHEDHIGNNHLFQDNCGATVYAHREALPFINEPNKIELQFYRKIVWQRPLPAMAKPVGEVVDTGKRILKVIPTPGHSPDHICLYEPIQGFLFSGDIFCGQRLVYMRADEDFALTLCSLKCLANLEVKTVFCGLKGAIDNGAVVIRNKIRNMERLRDQVHALRKQKLSPTAIKQKILGPEDKMSLITRGHFSKQNVIDSILESLGS